MVLCTATNGTLRSNGLRSGASTEHVAKMNAARRANAAVRRASLLRRDFMDASTWEDLARTRGLRLPPWGTTPTPGPMRSWLGKVGVSLRSYYVWSGERTLTEFADRNPDWPLRARAGLVLEAIESGHLQPAAGGLA